MGEPPRVKVPGRSLAGDGLDAQETGITVETLEKGMRLQGTVRNVVAFGAFVDIGVGHDGLLHLSKYGMASPVVNDHLVVKVVEVVACEGKGGKDGKGGRGRMGAAKARYRIALAH